MKRFALILALLLVAALLGGCAPRNTMSPLDLLAPETVFTVSRYDGETLARTDNAVRSNPQRAEAAEQLIAQLRTVPAQLTDAPEITFPLWGIEGKKPNGMRFRIAFTNRHCVTEDGLWYRFDYDFDDALERLGIKPEPVADDRVGRAIADFPCGTLLFVSGASADDAAWRADLLRPVPEQQLTPPAGITATLLESNSATISIRIRNDSGEVWTYGDDYHLEFVQDGVWYTVPYAMSDYPLDVALVSYSIADGQEKTLTFHPTESIYSLYGVPLRFGLLLKGHYRIVTNGLALEFDI